MQSARLQGLGSMDSGVLSRTIKDEGTSTVIQVLNYVVEPNFGVQGSWFRASPAADVSGNEYQSGLVTSFGVL